MQNLNDNIRIQMLEDKLKRGLKLTGEYIGDDDSGLEVDTEALEMEGPIDPDKLRINLKVRYLDIFDCLSLYFIIILSLCKTN